MLTEIWQLQITSIAALITFKVGLQENESLISCRKKRSSFGRGLGQQYVARKKIILLLYSAKLILTCIKYFSRSCEVSSTMKPVKPPPGSAEISYLLRIGLQVEQNHFVNTGDDLKRIKKMMGCYCNLSEQVSLHLNSTRYFKSHYSQHNT